ncbi:MAG TPA: alcohol dehydrogenase catalytic domain-containing protein [Ktedonobacterales bacterium]
MYSAYLDLNPARALSVRTLGSASRRIYFSPVAPLRVRRMPTPPLPDGRWVRVRNVLAGLAIDEVERTITSMAAGLAPTATPQPRRIYLGREVVGEVVEVGPDARFLRVGDRVAYQDGPCCATHEIEPPCRQCATGAYALCENRYLPGAEQVGGGWGDEMVVHERQLFLVPDGIQTEQAALLEPTASALHAAMRYQPQIDDQALVLGAETHGMLITQALRVMWPLLNITVAPQQSYQVEVATRMGASRILYPEDGVAAIARMTGAKLYRGQIGAEMLVGGFDVVYDTLGTEQSLRQALTWAREGGAVVLAARSLHWMRMDLSPIWNREVTLLGAYAHGAESWPGAADSSVGGLASGRASTFALAAEMLREERLTPERLVTHRFPLREVKTAIAAVRDRVEHRAIKVLLDTQDIASVSLLDEADEALLLNGPHDNS